MTRPRRRHRRRQPTARDLERSARAEALREDIAQRLERIRRRLADTKTEPRRNTSPPWD